MYCLCVRHRAENGLLYSPLPQLGTHLRGKRKREEMANVLRAAAKKTAH